MYSYVFSCQPGTPRTLLSATFNNNQMFHYNFQTQRTEARLPDFRKWDQYPFDLSTVPYEAQLCQFILARLDGFLKDIMPQATGAPVLDVFTRHPLEFGKPNTLICFISNFFPPFLNITWKRQGVPVTSGVWTTDYSPTTDGGFYVFSYVNITPRPDDVYTCSVTQGNAQYSSVKNWVPRNPVPSDLLENALCGLALSLGVVGIAVGIVLLLKCRKPQQTEPRCKLQRPPDESPGTSAAASRREPRCKLQRPPDGSPGASCSGLQTRVPVQAAAASRRESRCKLQRPPDESSGASCSGLQTGVPVQAAVASRREPRSKLQRPPDESSGASCSGLQTGVPVQAAVASRREPRSKLQRPPYWSPGASCSGLQTRALVQAAAASRRQPRCKLQRPPDESPGASSGLQTRALVQAAAASRQEPRYKLQRPPDESPGASSGLQTRAPVQAAVASRQEPRYKLQRPPDESPSA
ncbi:hypothetical protein NDU88_012979 [Pleurodeles waltl]|uniref:Ig-like domain-containing protein n=1 Tax=Pleurodeles waltl TaxID=8319 RepID=A0AAV7R4S9_PLEWA|nr:hypothetical protein NDU88_012979 [Pleurodeles waltl]